MSYLVSHSCLTLWNPRDCSLTGSSVREDSPGKNTRVCCHALLQGIFPTQGSNPGIFRCRWILYHLSYQGSPFMYTQHLKLAIQSLSPPLLPRVYSKADQGPLRLLQIEIYGQFSCLVSCHQSTVTSCCDESFRYVMCVYMGEEAKIAMTTFKEILFTPLTFICCCSVTQLCPTLCDSMVCSMPGFPVFHQLTLLLKLMSIESMMPSNCLILCHPLLLLPSVFPSIRVFFNESVLYIRWSNY